MQLYPHQQDLLDRIYSSFQTNDRIIGTMPTGGGKSKIFAELARIERSRNQRLLFVAGRQELLNQAAFHLYDAGIPSPEIGFIRPKYPYNPAYPIQIASIDTLRNQKKLPTADWVIIDEAHHSTAKSYRALWDAYPQAKILGLTATPIRTNGQGFDDLFQDLQCGPSTAWLIASGYLSPFEILEGEAPSMEGIKIRGSEFDDVELGKRAKAPRLVGDLVKSWITHVRDRIGDTRTVVFSIDREHSDLIAAEYNQTGIPAGVIHGQMSPRERADFLRKFLLGQILVAVNTDIFSEGFDLNSYAKLSGLPEADIGVVQMARPTMSLIKYLQQVGRCLRIALGKKFAIILDHAGNCDRHKEPDAPRNWSRTGTRKEKKTREKETRTKDCDVCGENYIPIRARVCPNQYCGCRFVEKNLETDASIELVRRDIRPVVRLRRYLAEGEPPFIALSKFLEFRPTLEEILVGGRMTGYPDPMWAWDTWRIQNPGELCDRTLVEQGQLLKKDWTWLKQYSRGSNYTLNCPVECLISGNWIPAKFVTTTTARVHCLIASGEIVRSHPDCVRIVEHSAKQLQLFA